MERGSVKSSKTCQKDSHWNPEMREEMWTKGGEETLQEWNLKRKKEAKIGNKVRTLKVNGMPRSAFSEREQNLGNQRTKPHKRSGKELWSYKMQLKEHPEKSEIESLPRIGLR